jgi:hypothetical protein
VARNERVQVFDDNGKPKPGGKILPDPLFMNVAVKICPKCKKVGEKCQCERHQMASGK